MEGRRSIEGQEGQERTEGHYRYLNLHDYEKILIIFMKNQIIVNKFMSFH